MNRTKIERLVEARALVGSVCSELNTKYRICTECGLKHYQYIDDRKLANRLEGIDTTLGNIISALIEREKEEDT